MKAEERKTGCLGPLGPGEWYGLMTSLGFLFASYARHGIEEASDPKMSMCTDKKKKKAPTKTR